MVRCDRCLEESEELVAESNGLLLCNECIEEKNDLAHAKKDHENGMNEIGSAFGVPDYPDCECWNPDVIPGPEVKSFINLRSKFSLVCKKCGRVIE